MEDEKDDIRLTAEQVAKLKQVSLSTVKRATSSGILKSERIKTKKNQQRFTRRYRLSDVERWRSTILSIVQPEPSPESEADPKTVEIDTNLPDWIEEGRKNKESNL